MAYEQKDFDGDIQYLNLRLKNLSNDPLECKILDTRNSSIILRPSDYEMSVVRFSLDIALIPIFNPVIPDIMFPFRTDMSVTLLFGGVPFLASVNILPQDKAIGIFSYQRYLDYVNTAFLTAFTALKLTFPASPQTSAPLLYLDDASQLINLYVQDTYLDTNPQAITIAMNHNLYRIVNLPFASYFGNSQPNGIDYTLIINNSGILIPAVGARVGYPLGVRPVLGDVILFSQEQYALGRWSDLSSIVFSSNVLPINREYQPSVFGDQQNYNFSGNSISILTDFEIIKSQTPAGSRGVIQYYPQGEYRMITLSGTNPIKQIDTLVSWIDVKGVQRPIFLDTGAEFSMKLMFRKRPPVPM